MVPAASRSPSPQNGTHLWQLEVPEGQVPGTAERLLRLVVSMLERDAGGLGGWAGEAAAGCGTQRFIGGLASWVSPCGR